MGLPKHGCTQQRRAGFIYNTSAWNIFARWVLELQVSLRETLVSSTIWSLERTREPAFATINAHQAWLYICSFIFSIVSFAYTRVYIDIYTYICKWVAFILKNVEQLQLYVKLNVVLFNTLLITHDLFQFICDLHYMFWCIMCLLDLYFIYVW